MLFSSQICIHNIAFSIEKVILSESREKYAQIKHLNYGFVYYKSKAFHKTLIDGLNLCGLLVDCVLSAVWTLILTAPIHCIGTNL